MLKNYFLKFKKNNLALTKPAFSMIEIITVLLVISIGMTGIMSLIVQNIQSQSISRKTLIAYQLAQEGVELIRQVRDTNWRNGSGPENWRLNLNAGQYYMDYLSPLPVSAANTASGRLSKDSEEMYYSNPATTLDEEDFSRIITIAYPDGLDKQMKINSTVYWVDRGNQYFYTVETELYDWRK